MAVRRRRQQVERRLVSEWVRKTFPGTWVKFNARIGRIPEEWIREYRVPHLRFFNPWRRFIDAIVVDEGEVYLVEASVLPKIEKPGSLLLYSLILEDTPELEWLLGLPRHLVWLTAVEDPYLSEKAAQLGVETATYRPDWVIPALQRLLRFRPKEM